jgi:Amino acid transporters
LDFGFANDSPSGFFDIPDFPHFPYFSDLLDLFPFFVQNFANHSIGALSLGPPAVKTLNMSNSLFRKKSIAQIQEDAAAGFSEAEIVPGQPGEPTVIGLRRSLGTFDLTMMGIAAIIGAGIFAMVGQASFHGGPGVILLFLFAALACGFSALCYAEFASKIPIAGSAYTYAYASFGELLAWIIGWDLLVEYAIGNIAVAISWSGYFTRLLEDNGIHIPYYFTIDYRSAHLAFDAVQDAITGGTSIDALTQGCNAVDATINCDQLHYYTAWLTAPQVGGWRVILDFPAVAIVVLITALVYIGIRESKIASNRYGRPKARSDPARDRSRSVLCQNYELASVSSAWVRRRDGRCRGGFLCIYRL